MLRLAREPKPTTIGRSNRAGATEQDEERALKRESQTYIFSHGFSVCSFVHVTSRRARRQNWTFTHVASWHDAVVLCHSRAVAIIVRVRIQSHGPTSSQAAALRPDGVV